MIELFQIVEKALADLRNTRAVKNTLVINSIESHQEGRLTLLRVKTVDDACPAYPDLIERGFGGL